MRRKYEAIVHLNGPLSAKLKKPAVSEIVRRFGPYRSRIWAEGFAASVVKAWRLENCLIHVREV